MTESSLSVIIGGMEDLFKRIVSITELRRNFGRITASLPLVESLILTKGGEPFATLKAVPEEKKKIMKKTAGAWRGLLVDNPSFWRKVLLKKSRRDQIDI